MADEKSMRYKIVAAPIGPDGSYRAWPDKTTYIRSFTSEKKRQDYWRRFVVPKSSEKNGLVFQLAMINEWRANWEFVEAPRYADLPVIGEINNDLARHIVECGRTGRTQRAS